jgi:hypothetical protein
MPRPDYLPEGWIYAEQTADDRAHPCCDFCNEPYPCFVFPAREFTMAIVVPGLGTRVQEFADDGWATCAMCAPMVTAHDVKGLLNRWSRLHPTDHGVLLGVTRTIFENFFRYKTGPAVAYLPGTTPPTARR